MRKSVLALALAVALPAAFAQTASTNGIEIYGIIDVGFESIDNGAVSINRLTSGLSTGSRLGIRGREDLGGGYAALFTLESRIEVDTGQVYNQGPIYYCGTKTYGVPVGGGVAQVPGPACPGVNALPPLQIDPIALGVNTVNDGLLQAGSTVNSPKALFDRQAYAGLITPFGAVLGGRMYTPAYEIITKFNSFYDSFAGNPGHLVAINIRANNALQYRAELKGFTFAAMYGFGGAEGLAGGRNERPDISRGDDFWGVQLQYNTNVFGIGAGYQNNRTVTYANPTENSKGLETFNVGATMSFGGIKLFGQYLKSKNDNPVLRPQDIQNLVIANSTNPANISTILSKLYINRFDIDALRGFAGPIDLDMYHLGLEWALGNGRLLAAYNHAQDSARSAWATADAKVDSYGLAYYYYMSKRTWLYGAAALANNKEQSRVALGAACCVGGWTTAPGEDSRNIQIGIRHMF